MAKQRTKESSQSAPQQQGEIIRANINRLVEPASTFVSIYTNDTQLQMTPWDFRFSFGIIADAPTLKNPNVLVKSLCEVRMSPQHAKKVATILIQQLKHYEETLGQIPQPPEK